MIVHLQLNLMVIEQDNVKNQMEVMDLLTFKKYFIITGVAADYVSKSGK
jgi:hypothetical protein